MPKPLQDPTSDDLVLAAAMANFGAMAAEFVTRPESWPVFVSYVRTNHPGCEIEDDPAHFYMLADGLKMIAGQASRMVWP